MRTVLMLPNWVGDTVMALPVVEALAAANRRLTVLAKPHLVPLIEPLTAVAEALARGRSSAEVIRQMKHGRFDEVVILPNSFRSSWLALRAGIARRWGYSDRSLEGLTRALTLRPAVHRRRTPIRHQVEDYAELLAAMEVQPPADWSPRLALSPEQRARGRELLSRARLETRAEPLIGIFAGAEFGPSKRWPWERFAELARELRRRRPGSRQVILAGPKEVWQAVRIHEESGRIHPVIGPDLDLGQLLSVVARLDLLITNDSGPMHLAAAVGVPCLALFGPTDPRRTRPFGGQHRVVYRDRWCSPCFRRRCPLLHHRCMRDIAVVEVLDDCLEMLDLRAVGR